MGMEDAQKVLLTFRDREGRLWNAAAAISLLYPADAPYIGENGGSASHSRKLVEGEGSSLVDFKVVQY